MKTLIQKTLLILLLLSLGGSLCTYSQNYRPFIQGKIYSYSCTYVLNQDMRYEGLYGLRIDSSYLEGNDSVFVFNKIVRNRYIDQDNIFGHSMYEEAGGVYRFASADSDTFLIHTQVPVQTQWMFHSDSGIVATLESRTELSFLGVVDSVITISLSNGDTLQISHTYGLIKTPAFVPKLSGESSVVQAGARQKGNMRLLGIEDEIGINYPTYRDIFDYEIGDRFIRTGGADCFGDTHTIYNWHRILDRWDSPGKDSIRYLVEVESAEEIHVSGYDGTRYLGIDTIELLYHGQEFSPNLSFEFNNFEIHAGPYRSENWNGAYEYGIAAFNGIDPDGQLYSFEYSHSSSYAIGLGQTYTYTGTPKERRSACLLCSEKRGITEGNCFEPADIVSNERLEPLPDFSLFPNPAKNQIRIGLGGFPVGIVKLELLDLRGRVLETKVSRLPGPQEIDWTFAAISEGLYLLRIQVEDGRNAARLFSVQP